jgi:hypothetical protein
MDNLRRETDSLKSQIPDLPDPTWRTHSVAEDFGESDPDPAELRERLAAEFDVAPRAFEGVDRDTLETILAAEREHADRSPSADMRGRGGASDSEDDETRVREHSAAPGRGANGSPKKGREAWKRRQHSAESGRASNGYPKPGRSNWQARDGRSATERLQETRREHAESGEESAGYPAKGRSNWRARGGDERDMSRRERDLSK